MSPLLILVLAVLATTYSGPLVRFATAAIVGGILVLAGIALSLGAGSRERFHPGRLA